MILHPGIKQSSNSWVPWLFLPTIDSISAQNTFSLSPSSKLKLVHLEGKSKIRDIKLPDECQNFIEPLLRLTGMINDPIYKGPSGAQRLGKLVRDAELEPSRIAKSVRTFDFFHSHPINRFHSFTNPWGKLDMVVICQLNHEGWSILLGNDGETVFTTDVSAMFCRPLAVVMHPAFYMKDPVCHSEQTPAWFLKLAEVFRMEEDETYSLLLPSYAIDKNMAERCAAEKTTLISLDTGEVIT